MVRSPQPCQIDTHTAAVGLADGRLDDDLAGDVHGTFSDDELAEQALAADPDAGVADDAVPFAVARGAFGELLPDWYMPAPAGPGDPALRGRRRVVSTVVVGSILLVNAMGLCITYGSPEVPFF